MRWVGFLCVFTLIKERKKVIDLLILLSISIVFTTQLLQRIWSKKGKKKNKNKERIWLRFLYSIQVSFTNRTSPAWDQRRFSSYGLWNPNWVPPALLWSSGSSQGLRHATAHCSLGSKNTLPNFTSWTHFVSTAHFHVPCRSNCRTCICF